MMKKLFPVLALLAVSAVVWLALGCEKPTQTDQSGQPQGAAAGVTDHKVTPAEVGEAVVCPVMGTKFKVSSDTLAAEYNGKVYYFCCPACPNAFKADPGKYAKSQ